MLRARRQQIDRLAETIRRKLGLTDVPVKVEDAVRKLGGRIETFVWTWERAGEHEASVRKGDKNDVSFVVRIQENRSDGRRRFSVAHELGHLFLHMGFLIDPRKWETIDAYVDSPMARHGHSEEEFEAHEFAGAFLMPAEDFRARVRSLSSEQRIPLEPIAEYFGVSVDAARTRGRWLGLFGWE